MVDSFNKNNESKHNGSKDEEKEKAKDFQPGKQGLNKEDKAKLYQNKNLVQNVADEQTAGLSSRSEKSEPALKK